MMQVKRNVILWVVLLMSFTPFTLAQDGQGRQKDLNTIRQMITRELISGEFDKNLIQVDILSAHHSDHNDVFHVYFQQQYKGIPIYKAVGNLAIHNKGQILKTSRLLDRDDMFYEDYALLDPVDGMSKVANHLQLPLSNARGKLTKNFDKTIQIENLPYSSGPVEVVQVYAKNRDGQYAPSWLYEFGSSVSADHWEVILDGKSGDVTSVINHTVHCSYEHTHEENNLCENRSLHSHPFSNGLSEGVTDDSEYRVFAPPLESPAIGDRTLVSNPADEVASPFGWHDTDGIAGPEFMILRGNNVHAYPDTAGNNSIGEQQTTALFGLTFDFPFERDSSTLFNLDADVTNLFFWNNYMHDWSYHFGFDEEAGNFQANNYGRGGAGDDYIFAETLDGSDTNNANFSAPRDGAKGRMQMFRWILGGDFEILSPPGIAGAYSTGSALFGPERLLTPVVQQIVYVEDDAGDIRDGCDNIVNGDQLMGRIAMIDRKDCDFSFKVHNAQEAGAIACVICNNNPGEGLVNMSGGENAGLVTIPSIFLSKEDCDKIKRELNNNISGRFNEVRELSASFDNGIVSHEYAHGISLRLTGGSRTSGCLSNDEQMGEGWSDFFGLVLTQLPDDLKEDARAIGTYVEGEPRDGQGIRRYPYSFDMSVNPQVMSHVRFSFRPHDVGEIWTDALWDMYWMFIDRYGYDPSWEDRESGNFKAVQIVMDGMKLQECDPSLLEARDAILQADSLNFQGENICLIWSAFSRRGMGVDAMGGDGDNRFDNVDGFSNPLSCGNELTLRKEVTPLVDAGEQIHVTLSLFNYREDLDGLTLSDEIPVGLTLEEVEGNFEFTTEGNKIIFDLGAITMGQEVSVSYNLSTSDITPASFALYDNMEGASQFDRSVTNQDVRGWAVTTSQSSSGIFSLRVAPDTLGGESFAEREETFLIQPENVLLKFDHKFGMDLGIDGGVLEISKDNGDTWEMISAESVVVNGYPDQISNCVNNCPFPDFFYRDVIPAFTGESDWQSTIVDLSEFMGEEIMIRFRHISLTFEDELGGTGWFIDDFELFEKKELSGMACIESQGGVLVCDTATTYVNSNAERVLVTEIVENDFIMRTSPNPAYDFINIDFFSEDGIQGLLRIISIDGRELSRQSLHLLPGNNAMQQDVSVLHQGVFFLELTTEDSKYTVAFIKQ